MLVTKIRLIQKSISSIFFRIIFISDEMTRYGSSYRRSALRTICWSGDSTTIAITTVREHDPVLTCARRPKGQITCGELVCEQCPTNTLNVTSLGNHHTVGVIGEGVAHNLAMHDRHSVLNRHHGMVLPSDIDWREMDQYPTGESYLGFDQIFSI